MIFGIVGFGFVGRATFLLENPDARAMVYDVDPSKRFSTYGDEGRVSEAPSSIEELDARCDVVFVCVPTPMKASGRCDTSLVEQVVALLTPSKTVVRSTVPLGFCDARGVSFMPEFLTEARWKEDFVGTRVWHVGFPPVSSVAADAVERLVSSAHRHGRIESCSVERRRNPELELAKLAKNAYLSTKVSFFNELHDLCAAHDVEYGSVVSVLKEDPRVGPSHMDVPGHDGLRGYGGTCLPKDTNGLYSLFLDEGVAARILEANLRRNEFKDRPSLDWINARTYALGSDSSSGSRPTDDKQNGDAASRDGGTAGGTGPQDPKGPRERERIALVTGGAGFLGSHLCESLLADGYRVVCMDDLSTGSLSNVAHLESDPRFEFKRHDVTRSIFLPRVDEIYHLACPASPPRYQQDPVRTIKTQVLGMMNVLRLCKHQSRRDGTSRPEGSENGETGGSRETGETGGSRGRRCRMLFASTSEVYGDPLVHPQSEGYWGNVNPIGPRACYDEGKRMCETMAVEYRRKHGLDVKTVRIFNTYGPRMDIDDGRVVTNFVRCVERGEPVKIYGMGSQTRSFCYVEDMVDGLRRMMASDHAGPINLGNPDAEVTMLGLFDVVSRVYREKYGVEPTKQHDGLPEDDPTRRRPDVTKARELLGWTPRTPLEEGLERTIASFRR